MLLRSLLLGAVAELVRAGAPGADLVSGRRQIPQNIYPGPPAELDFNQEPSPPTSEPERKHRTTRMRPTLYKEPVSYCEYGGLRCMRAFKTGILCARTAYYTYDTFRNHCEMDYVNCVYSRERWMVTHMGHCVGKKEFLLDYQGEVTYRSREDFLNNDYVVSEVGL